MDPDTFGHLEVSEPGRGTRLRTLLRARSAFARASRLAPPSASVAPPVDVG